jgi:hypothetical protein
VPACDYFVLHQRDVRSGTAEGRETEPQKELDDVARSS